MKKTTILLLLILSLLFSGCHPIGKGSGDPESDMSKAEQEAELNKLLNDLKNNFESNTTERAQEAHPIDELNQILEREGIYPLKEIP